MQIIVMTTQGEHMAEVITDNAKTWIVRLPDGHLVKRHKIKHRGWDAPTTKKEKEND